MNIPKSKKIGVEPLVPITILYTPQIIPSGERIITLKGVLVIYFLPPSEF